MILGIGTDIINILRIKKLVAEFDDKFCNKILTKNEFELAKKIDNLDKKIAFISKRFAAKEAFSKACGIGIGRGINFLDIEIYNDEFGKPLIKILNDKERFLLQHFAQNKIKIHLSLSDEKDLAQAMVIIENTNY